MAEIVDNSVDAGAKNIDILFIESIKVRGQQTISYIDKIIFIDNGKGMTEERLNGCLVFSDGEGKSDERIGAFGIGLPTSSLSVGKRVDVFSRTNVTLNWMYTFLDVEDQLNKDNAEIDFAIFKNPEFDEYNIPEYLLQDAKTIIVWSKLDKLDAAKADTLISRGEKLMGRIYRYKLTDDLNINFRIFRKGNPAEETIKPLLAYDPLYVTQSRYYMTSEIWYYALNDDPQGKHSDLGNVDQQFNSKYHYAKFIDGCIENETTLPLFDKLEGFWDAPSSITLNGKTYSWTIRAAYAKDSITNPGIRNGGGTKIGREFGKKNVWR
ncbi:ATP-binding protein [Aquirufa sp. A-Brett2-15D]